MSCPLQASVLQLAGLQLFSLVLVWELADTRKLPALLPSPSEASYTGTYWQAPVVFSLGQVFAGLAGPRWSKFGLAQPEILGSPSHRLVLLWPVKV